MALTKMKLKLTGIAPLILHNNQGVDALNYYAIESKKISQKRKKTEADHLELGRLDFYSSIYLDEDERPIVPARALAACFISGAKKDKNGPTAKAGVFFPKHARIIYDGPETVDELWNHGAPFVNRSPAKVGQSTIIRTRPYFENWELEVELEYDPTVIDRENILLAWNKAGHVCGLCDWRPQHGRFMVEEL